MSRLGFSSLRYRLLLPLLLSSALAAILVAAISLAAGRAWAMRDLRDRYTAIQQTTQQASFPLTDSVVRSLAKLSGTELVVLESADIVAASSLTQQFDVAELMARIPPPSSTQESDEIAFVRVGGDEYIALAFERVGFDSSSSLNRIVIVLFDKDRIDIFSRRAAMLPLVTGPAIFRAVRIRQPHRNDVLAELRTRCDFGIAYDRSLVLDRKVRTYVNAIGFVLLVAVSHEDRPWSLRLLSDDYGINRARNIEDMNLYLKAEAEGRPFG